ncbi:MAG: TlpA family protein disulfide reductase, partial [Terriglobales bacterium]
PAPCYLLRLATKGCPYCRADRPDFGQLARRANAAHCERVAVWPASTITKPTLPVAAGLELQFVTMPLARVLNPFVVPQSILLGSHGNIVWYRVGTIDRKSLDAGLDALDNIKESERASDGG